MRKRNQTQAQNGKQAQAAMTPALAAQALAQVAQALAALAQAMAPDNGPALTIDKGQAAQAAPAPDTQATTRKGRGRKAQAAQDTQAQDTQAQAAPATGKGRGQKAQEGAALPDGLVALIEEGAKRHGVAPEVLGKALARALAALGEEYRKGQAAQAAPAPTQATTRKGRKANPEDEGALIARLALELAQVDPHKRGAIRWGEIISNRVKWLGPDLAPRYLAEVAALLNGPKPREAVKFAIAATRDIRAALGEGGK